MKKANQQRAAEMQFQSQQAIFKILCQGCPYKAMPGARGRICETVDTLTDVDAEEIPSTPQTA